MYRINAGSCQAMPSVTLSRPFSSRFSTSQRCATSSGAAHLHVTEDVRVAARQLVAHGVGDGGQIEQVFLVAELGVEDDLEQQVAELLFHVRRLVATPVVLDADERLERVERLVGLFEQMTGQ